MTNTHPESLEQEGMCYGKPESVMLFFVVPVMCLAHLSGRCPEGVEVGLVATTAGLLAVFAGRKWVQPIKDDIGDKSVFMYVRDAIVCDVPTDWSLLGFRRCHPRSSGRGWSSVDDNYNTAAVITLL